MSYELNSIRIRHECEPRGQSPLSHMDSEDTL